MSLRKWVLTLALQLLTVYHINKAQRNCGSGGSKDEFVFARTLHAYYQGGYQPVGNESTFLNSLGPCNTTAVQQMVQFFRGYGVDLAHLTNGTNPFIEHETDMYKITTLDENRQPLRTRMYDVTYNEQVRFLNTVWHWAEWGLGVKVDFRGNRGALPKGHNIGFGMSRFWMDNRDHCISYHSLVPSDPGRPSSSIRAYELSAYQAEWGPGSIHVLFQASTPYISFTMNMKFPAHHP